MAKNTAKSEVNGRLLAHSIRKIIKQYDATSTRYHTRIDIRVFDDFFGDALYEID